jgi:hypothetical protein
MAGYSGTPLPQKLGIKPGSRLALAEAPAGFAGSMALPEGVKSSDAVRAKGPFDVIVAFVKSRKDFEQRFPVLKQKLDPNGGLWIAWPKKASKIATDMTEDVVRAVGLPGGLVDNKVCAIDEVWSGLRLVYRLADRPKAAKAAPSARPAKAKKKRSPSPTKKPGSKQ